MIISVNHTYIQKNHQSYPINNKFLPTVTSYFLHNYCYAAEYRVVSAAALLLPRSMPSHSSGVHVYPFVIITVSLFCLLFGLI